MPQTFDIKSNTEECAGIAARSLVKMLLALAEVHPYYARYIKEAAEKIRRRAEVSPANYETSILRAMEFGADDLGCNTVAEIAAETGLSPDFTARTLKNMLLRGVVRKTRDRSREGGRGGDRKTILYFPNKSNRQG